jgi:hypothetical protein
MPLKRTMVHADPEDLAIIKEAAAAQGVPEAEILRKGIHLAALGARRWVAPMDIPAFSFAADAASRADEDLDDWDVDEDAE